MIFFFFFLFRNLKFVVLDLMSRFFWIALFFFCRTVMFEMRWICCCMFQRINTCKKIILRSTSKFRWCVRIRSLFVQIREFACLQIFSQKYRFAKNNNAIFESRRWFFCSFYLFFCFDQINFFRFNDFFAIDVRFFFLRFSIVNKHRTYLQNICF